MNNRILVFALGVALAGSVHPATADSPRDRAKEQQKQMKQLAKDKDPEARKSAARELGRIGGTEAVDALAVALKDHSADVRVAATEALLELKDAAKGAIIPLKEALHDAEGPVRFNAMVALSNMNAAT